MELYGNVDSKFRFIILASKRAKQLLKGAKPKIETKSRNPVRIAQAEIMANLVEYEILPLKAEETSGQEDRVLGEDGLLETSGEGEADADEGDPPGADASEDSDDDEDQAEDSDFEDMAAESEESDEDE